jgi:dihydrolipoamide dehydrogenase
MYDIIILGFGPGGYEATSLALRKKLKVAVVEPKKLGGNCLNRACIPVKYLWSGAQNIEKLSKFGKYGIKVNSFSIDYTEAFKNKDEAIKYLRKSLRQLLKTKKVPIYKGYGKIIGENKVLVKDKEGKEEIIEGKNIIIATGSKPMSIGNIKLDEEYILSTDYVLEKLDKLPKSLLIVGGGVAGVELAYTLSKYGAEIYLVEIQDRLLPLKNIPKDVSRFLQRKFKELKINYYLNTTIENYLIKDGKIEVNLSNGENFSVDKIILSVGRKPNTEDIDDIGIEKDEKGFIKVNEYMQTNYKNIYAIGDVVNSPMLAYVSYLEGKVAIKNIQGENVKVDYSYIPYAIFTAQEIAVVGLTEEEAKEKGIKTISGMYPFSYNEKAVDENDTEGFVKLIFEKETKKLIGGYIVGHGASELVHHIEMALRNNYTAEDIHKFIYFHPSLSEIFNYASYDIAEGKLF